MHFRPFFLLMSGHVQYFHAGSFDLGTTCAPSPCVAVDDVLDTTPPTFMNTTKYFRNFNWLASKEHMIAAKYLFTFTSTKSGKY